MQSQNKAEHGVDELSKIFLDFDLFLVVRFLQILEGSQVKLYGILEHTHAGQDQNMSSIHVNRVITT